MNNGNQCWNCRSQTEWCTACPVITLSKNDAGHESMSARSPWVMVHKSSLPPRPMKYARLASQNKSSFLSRPNTIIPFPGCKHSGYNATNFMLGKFMSQKILEYRLPQGTLPADVAGKVLHLSFGEVNLRDLKSLLIVDSCALTPWPTLQKTTNVLSTLEYSEIRCPWSVQPSSVLAWWP